MTWYGAITVKRGFTTNVRDSAEIVRGLILVKNVD